MKIKTAWKWKYGLISLFQTKSFIHLWPASTMTLVNIFLWSVKLKLYEMKNEKWNCIYKISMVRLGQGIGELFFRTRLGYENWNESQTNTIWKPYGNQNYMNIEIWIVNIYLTKLTSLKTFTKLKFGLLPSKKTVLLVSMKAI